MTDSRERSTHLSQRRNSVSSVESDLSLDFLAPSLQTKRKRTRIFTSDSDSSPSTSPPLSPARNREEHQVDHNVRDQDAENEENRQRK